MDDWPTDEEMDAWIDEWEQVDADAAAILKNACSEQIGASPPAEDVARAAAALRAGVGDAGWEWRYFVNACGWPKQMPDDDGQALVEAVSASISPLEDPQTDVEEQAAVASLLHADLVGLVVGLVRRGVGAEMTAEAWQTDIDAVPEIDDDSDDLEAELDAFELAVEVLAPLWETLGVLDADRRLTELGRWALPNGLLDVWEGDREETDEEG
jgi:hypothetical protein